MASYRHANELTLQRREIRRLRRALREIIAASFPHRDEHDRETANPVDGCKCYRCIATRALKGKK